MTSDNGKKWPTRDKPDMFRSIEESLPSPTVCQISLVDGKLVYERVPIGSNGKAVHHRLGDDKKDEETSASCPADAVPAESTTESTEAAAITQKG